MEKSYTTQAALVLRSLVTVVRIICIHVRVPRVAAATIWGQGLVEETRYHHYYGVCKTFAAAVATVYQEPHF